RRSFSAVLRALFLAPRPKRARPTRAWMRIASLRSMCISSSLLRGDVGVYSGIVNGGTSRCSACGKTRRATIHGVNHGRRRGAVSHKLVYVCKSQMRTPPGAGQGGESMRERSSVTLNLACAFAVISTAALAYGIASRPAARERVPEVAVRAETIVIRSDKDRNVAALKLRAAEESAVADRALFIPQPMYAQVAARPTVMPVVARTQTAPVVAAAPARKPAQVHLASIAAKPAVPAHSLTPPGAIIND